MLDEIARLGARRILMAALEAKAADYPQASDHERDSAAARASDSRRTLQDQGSRPIMTGL